MKDRKTRERELHKRLATEYDENREGTPTGRYYSKKWLETMLAFMPQRTVSLLDVGCGTGIMYEVILEKKKKFDYSGTDFSKDMVGVGKKRYKGADLRVDDAEKLSYRDSSFDGVVMRSVLHHIPHPAKAVKEMVRVCKNNGTIIISEPHRNFLTELPRWLSKKLTNHFDEDHTHYSRKQLAQILKSGGVKEYKIVPFGFLAYPVGLPDLVPLVKYVPLFVLKALFVLDRILVHVPLLNRISWHLIVVAKVKK